MCLEYKIPREDKTSPISHTNMAPGAKYNISEDALLVPSTKKTPPMCIDCQTFIDEYFKHFQEYPTVSEYVYTALLYWWNNKIPKSFEEQVTTEGVALTSRRSELSFMYFDLDIKYSASEASTWEDNWPQLKLTLSKLVHNEVVRRLKGDEYEMVVTSTIRPRALFNKSNEPTGIKKVGVHIYFPTLVVNFTQAMLFLHLVTTRVRQELGERNILMGENAWTEVFDTSVYNSGLRDCYTYKPCCRGCESLQIIYDKNSMYVPDYIINASDVIPITKELSYSRGFCFGPYDLTLHRLTRIRCSSKEAEKYRCQLKSETIPTSVGYIPDKPDSLVVSTKRATKEDPLQFPKDLERQRKFRHFELLYFAPHDLARIESCIRENFNEGRYRNVQIRSIYAFGSRDKDQTFEVLGQQSRFKTIKITLKGDGSRYCINKGDHHNSNTAYFEIVVRSPNKLPVMEQRCWSPNTYKCNGAYRKCDKFRSGHIMRFGKLSTNVIKLLFHNQQAQPVLH